MSAFVVLVLAAFSRIVPHSLHLVGWNFTALGGGLLFFGSRMRGTGNQIAARLAAAMAILIATDYYLTVFAYQYPFHISHYLVTWIWYAAACLLGMGLLQKPGILRCAAATLASATSFFLLSNAAVWAAGTMYPHTLAGLGTALTLGLPFYRNDLTSTALTLTVLFGLPALARHMAATFEAAGNDRLA